MRRAESAAIVRHVKATYSADGDSLSASGPTSHDVAVVVHCGRDVPGVKNSPDIHDLIADDVEHQVREASQRADAKIRNLELVGESQAARLR